MTPSDPHSVMLAQFIIIYWRPVLIFDPWLTWPTVLQCCCWRWKIEGDIWRHSERYDDYWRWAPGKWRSPVTVMVMTGIEAMPWWRGNRWWPRLDDNDSGEPRPYSWPLNGGPGDWRYVGLPHGDPNQWLVCCLVHSLLIHYIVRSHLLFGISLSVGMVDDPDCVGRVLMVGHYISPAVVKEHWHLKIVYILNWPWRDRPQW